ncbi:MAG: glutamate-cysteine ligase family protein [Actinomycetota bacterium]
MVSPKQALSVADVHEHIRTSIFTSSVEGRVGVEVEWLPIFEQDPDTYVPLELLEGLLDPSVPLPQGSGVTFEPGGQIELSSVPGQSVAVTCRSVSADLRFIKQKLSAHGIKLHGVGLDPYRPGRRLLQHPRYRCMESYFDSEWPAGRSMMRASSAVHVNLDVAGIEDGAERWRLVHALGPTLSAVFANSAIAGGRPTGLRSTRLGIWQAIDPSRTLPTSPVGDPVQVWARYALEARVMFINVNGELQPMRRPMSFGEWLADGHALGFPELSDLEAHLTTLFPPIRPKGWLELRMIDALPDPWWRVPVALASAIVYDEKAARSVQEAIEPTADLWAVAARHGMSHSLLAESARVCFAAALEALDRLDVDDETARIMAAYNERYVVAQRSPADDQLDAWSQGRPVLIADETLEETWT